MKYTKTDIYEGMIVRWKVGGNQYQVTQFDPNKPEFIFIGVDNKHNDSYRVEMLLQALNIEDCTEVSKKPEIQYEIY